MNPKKVVATVQRTIQIQADFSKTSGETQT
jgi:hypothetical protein